MSVEGGSHRTLHNRLTTFLKSFLSQILKALILMLVPLASRNNAEQCSYCLVVIYFVKMHNKYFTSDRISPYCTLEDDVSHEFRRNEGSSEIGFSNQALVMSVRSWSFQCCYIFIYCLVMISFVKMRRQIFFPWIGFCPLVS